jgi:hypothetical protein
MLNCWALVGPFTLAELSGPNSGDVVVKPENQTAVRAFDVRDALQGTGGALGPWTIVTLTGTRKVTIPGLTLAGIYQFQIRAPGQIGLHRLDGHENLRRRLAVDVPR